MSKKRGTLPCLFLEVNGKLAPWHLKQEMKCCTNEDVALTFSPQSSRVQGFSEQSSDQHQTLSPWSCLAFLHCLPARRRTKKQNEITLAGTDP